MMASKIENLDEEIISIAHQETNIPKETLRAEKAPAFLSRGRIDRFIRERSEMIFTLW